MESFLPFSDQFPTDEDQEQQQQIQSSSTAQVYSQNRPEIVNLKLKWLIFSKTFNVKKRMKYNPKHANFCLIKGLEFIQHLACDSKKVIYTLETYLITYVLHNNFVLELKDLV